MDQIQTNDNQDGANNDLQKAIDDITNATNTDPVFSDPVAAPSSVPEGDTGELGEPVGPFPEPEPEPKVEMPTMPATEPIAPLEAMNIPEINDFEATAIETPAPETPAPEESTPEEPVITETLSIKEIKKAALRDLVPVLGKIKVNSAQKFNIYRDIFEELNDYSVLDPAYQAAREITDEDERAQALLSLVEAIDNM